MPSNPWKYVILFRNDRNDRNVYIYIYIHSQSHTLKFFTIKEKNLPLAKWASQIGDKIPQPIVAVIVHWLLLILVLLLLCGGLGVLVCIGGIKLFTGCTEKLEFADDWSLLVFLVSLALSIFFADEIRAVVPINLLLLNIIIHALYVLVRWYVKGCRESRGYY